MTRNEPQLGAPSRDGGVWRFERSVSVISDPYLVDHLVEGIPVFPAAYHMALMTQAARHVMPQLAVVGFRDVQFVQPARLRGHQALHFRVDAQIHPAAPGAVAVCISSHMPPPRSGFPPIVRIHARGEVLMGIVPETTARFRVLDFSGAAPYADLYRLPREIHHGPAFLAGIGYRQPATDQLLALVAAPGWPEAGWRAAGTGAAAGAPASLLNAILHVGFSLAGLHKGETVLPLVVESGQIHDIPDGPVQVFARRTACADDRQAIHVAAWDTHGRHVAVFRGFMLQALP